MSQQQRFALAFVLSIGIFFGFNYLQRRLYPPPPVDVNANTSATPDSTASPQRAGREMVRVIGDEAHPDSTKAEQVWQQCCHRVIVLR